jgi:hypothetical protein
MASGRRGASLMFICVSVTGQLRIMVVDWLVELCLCFDSW